jgi:excisionase family DNA binding protein
MGEIITPLEVAALLRIHVRTVYKLAEEGVIPGNRIGRSWRFSKKDILALVSNNQGKAPKGEPFSRSKKGNRRNL